MDGRGWELRFRINGEYISVRSRIVYAGLLIGKCEGFRMCF